MTQPWTTEEIVSFSQQAQINWSKNIDINSQNLFIWAEELDKGFEPRGIYHLFDEKGNLLDVKITPVVMYPENNYNPRLDVNLFKKKKVKK